MSAEPIDRARRALLVAGALAPFARIARADAPHAPHAPLAPDVGPELRAIDLDLPGGPSRRAVVLVPRDVAAGTRLPVLVLLHGLGETGSPRAGAWAWVERYGLATSYARLAHPPVRTEATAALDPARAATIDAELAARPFRGMVIACPYTPNPWRAPSTALALDRYAAWIVEVLLPAVRERAPARDDAAGTWIDGCSMGGFVALEAFVRRAEAFGQCGGVQSAISVASAPVLARRIADTIAAFGPRRVHVETSSRDPYREANLALARGLTGRGVPNDLLVPAGPHDQPWLRAVGTLEMLLWHDRARSD